VARIVRVAQIYVAIPVDSFVWSLFSLDTLAHLPADRCQMGKKVHCQSTQTMIAAFDFESRDLSDSCLSCRILDVVYESKTINFSSFDEIIASLDQFSSPGNCSDVYFLIAPIFRSFRFVRTLISLPRPSRSYLPPMETPQGGNLIMNLQNAI
jgi:hypothetical protein